MKFKNIFNEVFKMTEKIKEFWLLEFAEKLRVLIQNKII
jgi:hypothetical protein